MYCEIVHSGWWEQARFLALCEFWILLPLVLVDGSFIASVSFLTCKHWSALSWKTQEEPSANISRSFSVHLYPLQYSSPWILDALASLNPQLYLPDAVTTIPFPHAAVWKHSPSVNWGNHRPPLVCLLTGSQRLLSFIAGCLRPQKLLFHIHCLIFFFPVCFQAEECIQFLWTEFNSLARKSMAV